MKIYDEIKLHENKIDMIEKFTTLLTVMYQFELLSMDGQELVDNEAFDENMALQEGLFNDEGNELLNKCYNEIISSDIDVIPHVIINNLKI